MKKFLIYFIPYLLMAQSTGTIMGHVKDAKRVKGCQVLTLLLREPTMVRLQD